MSNDRCSITIGKRVARTSNAYERCNGDLKREYVIQNIELYNYIARQVDGNCGTFGTGYPFYALQKGLNGKLPIIAEQIRYNNALIKSVNDSEHVFWPCLECLTRNYGHMPDLKQICKTCPNIDDELKPRKLLNRLPDIDMWLVCDDNYCESAAAILISLFQKYRLLPSDIDPVKTIEELWEIARSLKTGLMPKYNLPLDAHIISYSNLALLIEKIPYEFKRALDYGEIPYLPIHPLSYRKVWQHDDTAYNFVHDFLSSLTEFNFNDDLNYLLQETRAYIANGYTFEELYDILIASGPKSVKDRHKTLQLKKTFEERIKSWQI
ncbi:MAG: hypothetical protein PHD02_00090 [Bacilli bacterium]|nr:hypothetical protein [Bacilli bacterium]